jgi:hypothetical protein
VNFIARTKKSAAMMSLAVFVLLSFLYSFASARLQRTIVTAPIGFTITGTAAVNFKMQI